MALLDDLEDFIRNKIEKERWTHSRLSDWLQQAYPGEKGLSVRSVRRFCSEKDTHKTSRISGDSLNCVVTEAISKVKEYLYVYSVRIPNRVRKAG